MIWAQLATALAIAAVLLLLWQGVRLVGRGGPEKVKGRLMLLLAIIILANLVLLILMPGLPESSSI